MGEKINRLIGIIRDFGRKPYMYGTTKPPYQTSLKGGGESASYREQMSRVSEYAVRVQLEYESSQLKKPYMSDGFPEMEHFYSPFEMNLDWDWDDFNRPPLTFLDGESPATPPVGSDGYCYKTSRSCNITHRTDLDAGVTYLKVHHGPEEGEGYTVYIDTPPEDRHRIIAVQDEYIDNFWSTEYVKIAVSWNMTGCEEPLKFKVIIKWLNACSRDKNCEEDVAIECDPCDEKWGYVEPTWADSPAIIGYAGSQTLTVDNGAAPYTYTLEFTDQESGGDANFTGTGKYLKTDSQTIEVTTDDLCGYVEITVVDGCENSPEGKGTLLAGNTGLYTVADCDECYTCTAATCGDESRENAGPANSWGAGPGVIATNGIYQGTDKFQMAFGLQCPGVDPRCDDVYHQNTGTADGYQWYANEFGQTCNPYWCCWYPPHGVYYCLPLSAASLKRWLCTG